MPERSLRGVIAVGAVITLAWLTGAVAWFLHGTRALLPVLLVLGVLLVVVAGYGVSQAMRAQRERIEHGSRREDQINKGSPPK